MLVSNWQIYQSQRRTDILICMWLRVKCILYFISHVIMIFKLSFSLKRLPDSPVCFDTTDECRLNHINKSQIYCPRMRAFVNWCFGKHSTLPCVCLLSFCFLLALTHSLHSVHFCNVLRSEFEKDNINSSIFFYQFKPKTLNKIVTPFDFWSPPAPVWRTPVQSL